MNFEKLYSVLNKRGFFNTFQVLAEYPDFKVEKSEFYRKLNEFSNYNSFLRLKDKLLETELIQLFSNNGDEYIGLTEKGKTVFGSLKQLNDLIKEKN